MKVKYVADDGKEFDREADCKAHEVRCGLKPTAYAVEIAEYPNGKLRRAAIEYSRWLREKQTYPATDSGEHHCCDLLYEMAKRLLSAATSPDACVGDDQARPPPGLPSGEEVAHHTALVRAVAEKLSGEERVVWVVRNDDQKSGEHISIYATRQAAIESVVDMLETYYPDTNHNVARTEAITEVRANGQCDMYENDWYSVFARPVNT